MQAYLLNFCLCILLCLAWQASSQNNPICKAKRYQCQTQELPAGVCVMIQDEQEKYYYVRQCTGQKSYCPIEKAAYGKPAYCEAPIAQATKNKVPFDECSKDEECLSLQCISGRCKGKLETENCLSQEDCDVGLFCDTTGVCLSQKEFDQDCKNDLECANNCVCNNQKCAFYYTFTEGAEADNPTACESGFIENGKCAPGLKTKSPGQPCTIDADCMFIDPSGTVRKTGTCTCGFNAGSRFLTRLLLLLQSRDRRPRV